MFRSLVLTVAATLAALPTATSSASWFENGNVLAAGADDQFWPQVVTDGAGGVFVSWSVDSNITGSAIRMQRLDSRGNRLWGPGGIVVYPGPLNPFQQAVSLAADGLGGAILSWEDTRAGNPDIYAQRVDGSGNLLWGAGGLAICTHHFYQTLPSVVSDGAGGAYVGWTDDRDGLQNSYVQKVSAAGVTQWTANGVPVAAANATRNNHKLVSFGIDGVVAVFNSNQAGNTDIYAQRFNFLGVTQWTASGKKVCGASGSQLDQVAIGDVDGGILVAWTDHRSANSDIYVQRLDPTGTAQWGTDGTRICNSSATQSAPQISSDGAGGAVVSWVDLRGGDADIYARRVDADGSLLWLYDGLLIASGASNQIFASMIPDGSGGTILSWQDFSSSNWNLRAQRLDANGGAMWSPGGGVVCDASWDQQFVELAQDGSGGVLLAWQDHRNEGPSSLSDIYAQRLEPDFGTWGFPEPVVDSVADIPGDQGGTVAVNWTASQHDKPSLQTVSHYSIWRATDAIPKSGAQVVAGPEAIAADFAGSAYWAQQKASGSYYWEWVGNQDALFAAAYSAAAPTRSNSTGSTTHLHHFQVVTHDGVGVYASAPASGESYDNLAPATPQQFAGMANYAPQGLHLSWTANAEPDLHGYALYRGSDPDFIPGPGNRIGTPAEPAIFEDEWSPSSGYHYKLSALDLHGNESGHALLSPQDPTDTPGIVGLELLAQNVPNPFNPATTLAYEIGRRGHVLLSIYDLAGRRIATPVDEVQEAGRHRVVWNGRDALGRAVASGVYLYRMQANGSVLTKRMVLVR